MKRLIKFMMLILLLAFPSVCLGQLDSPPTQTLAKDNIDVRLVTRSVWNKLGNGDVVRTDRVGFSGAYSLTDRIEVNAGYTFGWAELKKRRAFDRGTLALGVKGRLWENDSNTVISGGYQLILPSDGYRKVSFLVDNQVQGAYLGIAQGGVNHKAQVIASVSSKAGLAGMAYGEFLFRSKEQDHLRLGNEAKLGGGVYYTLTPQVALLFDTWWVDKHKASILRGREKVRGTGGSQAWVAPSVSVGFGQFAANIGYQASVNKKLGALVPRELNAVIVSFAYRF